MLTSHDLKSVSLAHDHEGKSWSDIPQQRREEEDIGASANILLVLTAVLRLPIEREGAKKARPAAGFKSHLENEDKI